MIDIEQQAYSIIGEAVTNGYCFFDVRKNCYKVRAVSNDSFSVIYLTPDHYDSELQEIQGKKELFNFLFYFLGDNNNPPKDRIKDTEESLILLSNQPTAWGCMWMFLLNSGEVIQCMTKNIDNAEARKKAMQILEARGY